MTTPPRRTVPFIKYQDPDGRWVVELTRPNGKRVWCEGATEAEAMERARERAAEWRR